MLAFQLEALVRRVLDEDLGDVGDITTLATVDPDLQGGGAIVAREPVIVSGLEVAEAVFRAVDPRITFSTRVSDGTALQPGEALCRIEGPLASILTAERPALNFMGHLSGIATHTRRFVAAVGEGGARLTATRKTTPGLRALEKAAVRHGGAHNHRFGLFDGILIKDNHVVACGSIAKAVARAKNNAPHHLVKVGVEVDRIDQIDDAIEAGADHLLLDNMDVPTLKAAVAKVAGRATTEASGGINLETAPAISRSGVDFLSSGGLIHQARWVDIGLDFDALDAQP